jgi:hypothetical protein
MAGVLVGGGACCCAIIATMFGAATHGWGAALLGQPAVWTVPLAFTVMIATSLLTHRVIPPQVEHMMLRMHLPEGLIHRTYGTGRPYSPHLTDIPGD